MTDDAPLKPNTLGERIDAVEAFLDLAERWLAVGDMEWTTAMSDLRLLAINSSLRRQLESMRASILLSRQELGHLSVSFVRAALEDVLYLGWLSKLDTDESQELFLAMGNWDSLRSLLAQRAYLGDAVMAQLWYPIAMLDAAEAKREVIRLELKRLQKEYGWSGGLVPSADWLADRAGHRPLYDYLHAATSRAVHFSAGEVMRRGWGSPDGRVVTDKREFRAHLAEFALDQLPYLFNETLGSSIDLLEAAGVKSDENLEWERDIKPVLSQVSGLHRVPMVHAREWNLAPGGPLSGSSPDTRG